MLNLSNKVDIQDYLQERRIISRKKLPIDFGSGILLVQVVCPSE